jgi:hypothetical protein
MFYAYILFATSLNNAGVPITRPGLFHYRRGASAVKGMVN